jgi:hypothetical protein
MGSDGISGGLLGSQIWDLPKYDEAMEASLEALRLAEIRTRYQDRHPNLGGLFGLGAEAIFKARETSILLYARASKISLLNANWRQRALEAAAWEHLENISAKKQRGGQRKPRFAIGGLLGRFARAPLLDQVEALKAQMQTDGSTLTDTGALRLIVSAKYYDGRPWTEVIADENLSVTAQSRLDSLKVQLSRQRKRIGKPLRARRIRLPRRKSKLTVE